MTFISGDFIYDIKLSFYITQWTVSEWYCSVRYLEITIPTGNVFFPRSWESGILDVKVCVKQTSSYVLLSGHV